ncbi:MAG: sugar phosphate isomerase/epimerase family protein [bacterium]
MKQLIICDEARIKEALPLCKEYGLGLEIQAFYDPAILEKGTEAVKNHLDLIQDIEKVSMHGPFGDLCPGSFDPMVREVARKRFEQAYDIAVKLNVKHIVLHHGYVPNTSQPKYWIKRLAQFWQDFLDSREREFYYHIENHQEYDHEIIGDVVDVVNRSNFDICLDIGHTHCCSQMSALDWIKNLKNKIGYVHLHTNNGGSDEHLGLEKGTIPIIEVCNALNEYAPEAIWALEMKLEDTGESIGFLKNNGFI